MLCRRNEESPIKGIDTLNFLNWVTRVTRRNEESPIKGIDTVNVPTTKSFTSLVEMRKARLRALTQCFFSVHQKSTSYRRNEESPIKGIDTHHSLLHTHLLEFGRNEESPIKGIDTGFRI